jgi:hypothetical protein
MFLSLEKADREKRDLINGVLLGLAVGEIIAIINIVNGIRRNRAMLRRGF